MSCGGGLRMSALNWERNALIIFFCVSAAVITAYASTFVGDTNECRSAIDQTLPVEFIIAEKELNRSILFGINVIDKLYNFEQNLKSSLIHVIADSPSQGQLMTSAPEKQALEIGKDALIVTKATAYLMYNYCESYHTKARDCLKYLKSYSYRCTPLRPSCDKLRRFCTKKDISSMYRTFDGTCNNVLYPNRGAAFTAYGRILDADYSDDLQEPRRAINKLPLPSAREISTRLKRTHRKNFAPKLTLATAIWGQFVEHDMTFTASSKMVHFNDTIECCSYNGLKLSPRHMHALCAPIDVPDNDRVYQSLGVNCINYVRSVQALQADCTFGPAEQLNQATHYIDASHIYGVTTERSARLRSFEGGQLRMDSELGNDFPPKSRNPAKDCQGASDDADCLLSGDIRINLQLQLIALQTNWIREHNRVARILASLNSHWDDEKIYQEARRIVIAEIQHITYMEWLPLLLSKTYINKLNSNRFDSDTLLNEVVDDGTVSNSFATAVIRLMSTLLDDSMYLMYENRSLNMALSIDEYYFKPDVVRGRGVLNRILRGLVTQRCKQMDVCYEDGLNHRLFWNGVYGFDVFSLDIHRGRDHGLPSYTAYRVYCGLKDAQTFDDFLDVMPAQIVASLSEAYSHPKDVDLIVGGMSELPLENSLLGPTFSCLMYNQFLRTKQGDRYFYSNTHAPWTFSKSQIEQIKSRTLAGVICDNSPGISQIQERAFEEISKTNGLKNCGSFRTIDLSAWREGP